MGDIRPSMMARVRGGSGASTSVRFPLPMDYFPSVACSPEQEQFLREQADALSSEAVRTAKWAMSYEDGSAGWKLCNSQRHFRETGIRSYSRRRDGRDRSGARRLEFRCLGRVALPLARAMDALYSDNTLDFRSNSTFLVETCLDAAVLHVVERRSAAQPHRYLGLNWMASRSPGYFSKNRDICYLRSSGMTLDGSKEQVGYVVLQSVDLAECASLETALGLTRTKVSGVLMLKQSPDGHGTNVLWQGFLAHGGHSASKIVSFVHETFASTIVNLNQVTEAKYMAQQVEDHRMQRMTTGERKYCYICNKKFSLVRARSQCSVCGENMCKDCEISSRAKAFNSDSFDVPTPTSSRPEVTRFCKQCVSAARRDLHHPSFLSDDNNASHDGSLNNGVFTDDSEANAQCHDPNNSSGHTTEKRSTQSSSLSAGSLRKLLSGRSSSGQASSKRRESTPAFVGASTAMDSASDVPMSPLSILTQREKRRSRLETDPMESYDGFDNHEYGVPLEEDEYEPHEPESTLPSSDRRGSQEARDTDMAHRLREISQRAQEALDVTKRNSCMMSDTSSAPRVSDLGAFKDLDKSIAEQADLLNVIGFVSTGRVYMENNGPEQGGVRASESSSVADEDRFEVLT